MNGKVQFFDAEGNPLASDVQSVDIYEDHEKGTLTLPLEALRGLVEEAEKIGAHTFITERKRLYREGMREAVDFLSAAYAGSTAETRVSFRREVGE